MTNEEVERAIDFLLRSQANSEARIEQTNVQLNQLAGKVDQLAGKVDQLAGKVDQLAERFDQLAGQLGSFADTQTEMMRVMTRTLEAQSQINESLRMSVSDLAVRQSRTEETMARLADAQTDTNRRLGTLIKIVEEERGGR